VEELRMFVERMIRQTQEDLGIQRRKDPADEWMRFLEGKLLAFQLVRGQIEKLAQRKRELH
jgi:hypothetical protein